MLAPLCAVLLLSGAAGLVYQVTWVRLLGLTVWGDDLRHQHRAGGVHGRAGDWQRARRATRRPYAEAAARLRAGRDRHRHHRAALAVGAGRPAGRLPRHCDQRRPATRGLDRGRRPHAARFFRAARTNRAHGGQSAAGRPRGAADLRGPRRQPGHGPAVRVQHHRCDHRHAGGWLSAHRQLRHDHRDHAGRLCQRARGSERITAGCSFPSHAREGIENGIGGGDKARSADCGSRLLGIRHLGRGLARLRGGLVAHPRHPLRQHHLRLRAHAGHGAARDRRWQRHCKPRHASPR